MRKLPIITAFLFVGFYVSAQNKPITKGNYQLASRFSPKKLDKMLYSAVVDPHWLKKSTRFWYQYQTSAGKKWYIVDPSKASKQPLFDNDKLAASLTKVVKDPFDGQNLPIDSMKFIKDDNSIQFEVKSSIEVEVKDSTAKKPDSTKKTKKVFYFEYDLLSGSLIELKDYNKPKSRKSWASISPDSQTVVFSRNYNLFWMDKTNYQKAQKNEDDSTIIEHQLTIDGVEYFSYGGLGNETNVEKEKNKKKRKSATIYWSPGSKKFSMERTDQRLVKDLWVINSIAEPRPTLETYKYHMPGEATAPITSLLLFDLPSQTYKKLNTSLFKDQDIALWSADTLKKNRDNDYRSNLWMGDTSKFYVTRTSRDLKRIDICKVDVKSGDIKPLIEERMNTYVETRRLGMVNNGKELIEWSERDGWAHLYLYDENGTLKNQITSGSYHVEDIMGIDEKKRIVYFTANAKEANEDPYFLHFYKVNFDGSGLKLLNPGDFDNSVSLDDSKQYFVNNFSRVNTVPASVLYDNEGRRIMDLEKADLGRLFEAGYKFPQPFEVKADDGITDLYGVMYKPFDFDSTKKYPVIEYVYPGPQTEAVNKTFGRGMDRIDRLAQFGFIVVTVGNRGGSPGRSKWYHTFGYGNLRDYGLADKKAAIEQLADRYSFIDITKVGIHGHSGGGFMSTAAMLVYPDFFKVAVSESGNHENNIYNRWWSEKHNGVKEAISEKGDTSFVYAIEKNSDLAKNLKGRLLLSTGDIDNNVHPANTIRMANALIKANKRFEFVLLPGQRHAYGDMQEYLFWQSGDHFCKYLLGDFSQPVDILEMSREAELTGDRKRTTIINY
ncbi:MAG: DPP IV N-terminal domain-containing protein [Chitinophagaceae bacterium]